VPPRATTAELNHRYVEGSTEPVITTKGGRNSDIRADRTEALTLQNKSGEGLIAKATLDLKALTTGDMRHRGDNNTVQEGIRDTLLARAPGKVLVAVFKNTEERQAVLAEAVGNNMLLPAPWIKISKRLS
jgi:hypothetical protein